MSVGRFLQQAAAGNAGEGIYVDDVFSTYLYTGNGSTQTITNGIDLDGEGGLVWIKNRDGVGRDHFLVDSERGIGKYLATNATQQEVTYNPAYGITSFNSTGFAIGLPYGGNVNNSNTAYASWTFRKQPGFFDVVTYTGTGSTRTVSHNLGSTPGFVIIKRTDIAEDWTCWHTGVPGAANYIQLNKTDAYASNSSVFNNTAPTDAVFTVGSHSRTNASGGTYVAYLFAHDDQRFGTNSDESIIKCGTILNGSFPALTFEELGWEPQFLLVKAFDAIGSWFMRDIQRGWTNSQFSNSFLANTTAAESINTDYYGGYPSATGFHLSAAFENGGNNFIYVAIRRPHKPAEEFAATDLFDVIARSGTGVATLLSGLNFPPDAFLTKRRNDTQHWPFSARLTGDNYIYLSDSAAEGTNKHLSSANGWGYQDKLAITSDADVNASGGTYINYFLKRAPGFFDVVTYTGNGSTQTINHNLGVVPEIILFRGRDAEAWWMYSAEMAATDFLVPYLNNAKYTGETYFDSTRPTASAWTVKGPSSAVNANGGKYIAYLFASVPGISKFGIYTGNGTTTNNIDCGFSSGARFVVVKRTDSTGNWYVWDTERGIVAGNDPKLYFNSTGSEITSADEIDPYSAGFTISSSSTALNASGGSYLFLAIA